MANLPANPGEALWIGSDGGQNHANIGEGQGTSGGTNHTDYSQSDIVDGSAPPVDPNKFFLNSDGNVVFRINASAGTTSTNTKHPRSECREMQSNGTDLGKWDGRTGTHYLKARCRIITVTSNRPWICFGQIHGSNTSPNTSDLIRLQTEGTNGTSTNLSLIARRTPPGGSEIRTVLKTGYNVGDWFSYEIRMVAGTITVSIDGTVLLTATGMGQIDNYFKWGCYLQDSVGEGASSSDWGAVEFERGSVQVWNSGYPDPTTPVFTGGTDPNGGAGGGAGNDTAAPTVPGNPVGIRGNNQAALSWTASTDNVGVTGYRVYRFSATGSAGGSGSAAILGSQVNGASTTASSSDKLVASSAVAPAGGKLTAGHFRAWLDAAGSTTAKMVVYADSSGAPGARLATSDELTITSTAADTVRDFVFSGSAQITIVAGTTYWVAVAWADPGTPNLTFSRDVQSGKRVESTAAYGTPPNPFGTISGTLTGPIDAWCDVVSGTGAGTGGGGTTSSFGKTTDGASSSASSADKTAVSKFTATASGTLTAGHGRAWMGSAGSATVKCVVYADSSGAPGARLAASDPLTITNTAEALKDFTFSGADQIAIVSGTAYWLGLAWADPGTPSLTYSRDSTAGGRQEASSYAPSPFGTPSPQTGPIDVYVDVSSAGGSAGGGFALLTTVTGTSYTNTGLTNGQQYQYQVAAVDAAGNESARSGTITVIPGPPDTTAPTVPTGLTATALDGRVGLIWSRSTDADSGLYGYRVYRGGVLLDVVLAEDLESYQDTGLPNGVAYSYQVSALDRSQNESAKSSTVSATPHAAAITGVSLLPAALSSAKVEIAIAWGADPTASETTWTWSDVTTDVRHEPGISTSLGRNDESSSSNPADLKIVLNNSSGNYSLGTGSSHYPYVRRSTPVRVRVDPGDGGGGRTVFLGYADGFTPGWDALTGKIPVVTLSASGTLRRLAQGSAPVQSAYRRVAAALPSVVAYWPLEEGKNSAYAPALRGGSNFTFTGGLPDWESDTSLDCSAALPHIGDAYWQADVNAYTPSASGQQLRLLLSIPDSGLTSGVVLMHVTMTGTINRWDLTYDLVNGASALGLVRYASDGTRNSSDSIGFDVNGKPGRLSLDWKQVGSNIAWTMSFTPAARDASGGTAAYFGGTITGKTCGIISHFEINPHNASMAATIGHMTIENAITSYFASSDALVAHAGETATGQRLPRLCTENRVPLQIYGVPAGVAIDIDQMGPQLVAPLLDLLRECETSDQGQLWDGRNAGLSYSTRRRREAGTVKLTVDAGAGQLGGDFAPVDDDQRDRNKMTVTRLHGVSVTYEDVTGPKGTGQIGIYDDSITVNTRFDASVAQFARWFVLLGTQPGYRYPQVTVDLSASPSLAGAVLNIVPGERIDVTHLNTTLAGFPDATVSLIVEGIAHEITTRTWKVTFRCSLFAPWATGLEGA